jgi:hypothetical protein
MTEHEPDDDATFARRLFSSEPEDEPTQPPDPTKNNHSPREGANPTGQDHDDLRTFTAELFSRAD